MRKLSTLLMTCFKVNGELFSNAFSEDIAVQFPML